MGGNQGVSALAFSGVNTTTPINSTVQTGTTVGSSANSLTISSGASSRASVIVMNSRSNGEVVTPGAGDSEVADFDGGTNSRYWAAYSTASSASYVLSWTQVTATINANAAFEMIESTSPVAAFHQIIFMQ